jgi:hypothetical protein
MSSVRRAMALSAESAPRKRSGSKDLSPPTSLFVEDTPQHSHGTRKKRDRMHLGGKQRL